MSFKALLCNAAFISLLFSSFSHSEEGFSEVYQSFQQAYQNKDYSTASELLGQSYQLGKEKFGMSSENTANLGFSYANLLARLGDYNQASEVYDEVEDIYDDLYGDGSVEYFTF